MEDHAGEGDTDSTDIMAFQKLCTQLGNRDHATMSERLELTGDLNGDKSCQDGTGQALAR